MRVLHVIPAVAERYGGPSRAVVAMCAALRTRGIDAVLATTDADGPGRLPGPTGATVRHQGVPAVVFARQASEAFKYSRPLAAWLDREATGFDVVHVHAVLSHACLAAGRACRRHGIPYVVRPLGTLDPWSLGQKRLRKRLLWLLGGRALVHGAAAVHYTTEEERRRTEGALALARGVVIPLGVDEAWVKAAPTRDAFGRLEARVGSAPYVLALSRLHPKKGLEALLAAFLDVGRDPALAAWRLVVAGDGDPGYVAGLRRLADRLQAGRRVVFAGWLEGDRRRAALEGAGLLALPSRQENFALSVVEAMACGVPVLVSPEVNLAETIRVAGAGWVVPAEPSALRAGLATALADEAERILRGSSGRELVRTCFTWPSVAGELADLYDGLAGVGASRRG